MTQTALPASHLELTELNVLMAHRQSYSLQTPEQKPKAFMRSGCHTKTQLHGADVTY